MVAGVTIPGIALGLLAITPYIDKNPSQQADRPQVRDHHDDDVPDDVGRARDHRLFFRGPGFNFIFPWDKQGIFFEL